MPTPPTMAVRPAAPLLLERHDAWMEVTLIRTSVRAWSIA